MTYQPDETPVAPAQEQETDRDALLRQTIVKVLDERLAPVNDALKEVGGLVVDHQRRFTSDETMRRLQSEVGDAQAKVRQAEAQLTQAHESGEPAEIARAQSLMSQAAADFTLVRDRATTQYNEMRRQPPEQRRPEPAASPEQQAKIDDTNLRAWQSQNPWYGTDPELTATARTVDQQIQRTGAIPVGSPAYFAAIDREVRMAHPARFDSAPQLAGGPSVGSPTSSMPRSSQPFRFTPTMQASAERMGMTPEQWRDSRQLAVQKGLLGDTPAEGSVIARRAYG